ncbi:hypothetical protein, partial [Pseudonocardia sp. ICBG601]
MGVTTEQLKKMVTEGVVKIDDVLTTIGSGSSKAFQMTIAGSESASTSMKNQWKIATDNVRITLGEMLEPMTDRWAPQIAQLGARVSDGLRQIPGTFREIKRTADDWGVTAAIEDFRSAVARLVQGALPVFRGIMVGLGVAFGAAMVALRPLMNVLGEFGDWLSAH